MKRRRDRPSLYGLLVLVCLYGGTTAHGEEPMRDIGGSVLVPMPVPGPMGVKVKSTHSHAPTQVPNVPYFEGTST